MTYINLINTCMIYCMRDLIRSHLLLYKLDTITIPGFYYYTNVHLSIKYYYYIKK